MIGRQLCMVRLGERGSTVASGTEYRGSWADQPSSIRSPVPDAGTEALRVGEQGGNMRTSARPLNTAKECPSGWSRRSRKVPWRRPHVPARTLVPVYIDFIEVPAKADGLINGPRSHCEIHGTGALNDIERQSIHFHTGRVLVYNNGVFLKPYARYNITILIASTRTARRNEQQGDKAIHEHDQGYCPRERFPSRSGVFNRRSARLRAHMLPIPDFGKRLP